MSLLTALSVRPCRARKGCDGRSTVRPIPTRSVSAFGDQTSRSEMNLQMMDITAWTAPGWFCSDPKGADCNVVANMFRIPRSSSAFPPRFGHHAMKSLRPGMDTRDSIDSSMLEKLNRSVGRSGLSTSLSDLSHTRHIQPPPITLSLPHRTKQPYLESIFTNSSGGLSATSPLGAPFGRSSSFAEGTDYDRAPYRNFSRIHGGSVSEDRNGCAYTGTDVRDDDVHFPMDDSETTRMRSLHIDDLWASRGGERERDWDRDKDWERDHRDREYYQPGQKRRASSPPGDEAGLGSDPLRRRDGALARSSPTPRLLMPHSSAPSICSVSRSGSHTNHLPTTSNLTGMGSFGRRSPSVISPGGLSPTDQLNCSNNYPTPTTLSAAPHALTGRTSTASSPHQRTHSEQPLLAGRTPVSPRKLPEIPKSSSTLSAKLKGPYMCECCPKKPKKFDTEEELRYAFPLHCLLLAYGRAILTTFSV